MKEAGAGGAVKMVHTEGSSLDNPVSRVSTGADDTRRWWTGDTLRMKVGIARQVRLSADDLCRVTVRGAGCK